MTSARTFTTDQLEAAIKELVRLKLVEGWVGDLRIEYDEDDKQLHLTQYNSSSEWTPRSHVIYRIQDHDDWGEFIVDNGVHGNSDELRVWDHWDIEYEALRKSRKEGDEYVLSGDLIAQFFAELDWDPILEGSYQEAQQNLVDVRNELERRKEDNDHNG